MNILYMLLEIPLYLWLLWYLYIIVIGLYRAYLSKKLSWQAMALGFPALAIGAFLDWLINVTVATLFFKELPKSPLELVTGRLSRYISGPACMNKHYAQVICYHLLDPFDPSGKHCNGATSNV